MGGQAFGFARQAPEIDDAFHAALGSRGGKIVGGLPIGFHEVVGRPHGVDEVVRGCDPLQGVAKGVSVQDIPAYDLCSFVHPSNKAVRVTNQTADLVTEAAEPTVKPSAHIAGCPGHED